MKFTSICFAPSFALGYVVMATQLQTVRLESVKRCSDKMFCKPVFKRLQAVLEVAVTGVKGFINKQKSFQSLSAHRRERPLKLCVANLRFFHLQTETKSRENVCRSRVDCTALQFLVRHRFFAFSTLTDNEKLRWQKRGNWGSGFFSVGAKCYLKLNDTFATSSSLSSSCGTAPFYHI